MSSFSVPSGSATYYAVADSAGWEPGSSPFSSNGPSLVLFFIPPDIPADEVWTKVEDTYENWTPKYFPYSLEVE